jgi:hypothetical protein
MFVEIQVSSQLKNVHAILKWLLHQLRESLHYFYPPIWLCSMRRKRPLARCLDELYGIGPSWSPKFFTNFILWGSWWAWLIKDAFFHCMPHLTSCDFACHHYSIPISGPSNQMLILTQEVQKPLSLFVVTLWRLEGTTHGNR